ncbi:carbon-nitrogen hydrolase family protein [Skermanella stibiiresistens]|uniref:carbon-nitrogen hydrolase family protein n=1 Tax=Skermanella stibiiresistens TaxID=913326 RepID=UPI001B3BD45C|nr:carbon-nitrogen hydrolase family protein [Skermanella stibiiresistens]
MTKSPLRLALLQMEATVGDVAANLERVAKAAAEAAERGAACLLAPELALTGYGAGAAITALAEPADGGQVASLAAIAARTGVAVVCGFAEAADGVVYNSAAAVSPDGTRRTYRKLHLYGDYERALFRPGSTPPEPFQLGGLRAGLLICYDVEFPEMVRHLAVAGADLILVPTALPAAQHAAFTARSVVPVRAFENQIFVAYANHAGGDGAFTYAGMSGITAPDGTDLARADATGETMLIADLDPHGFDSSRDANPYLIDRRMRFTSGPYEA